MGMTERRMAEWRDGGMAEWEDGGMAEWRNGILLHTYSILLYFWYTTTTPMTTPTTTLTTPTAFKSFRCIENKRGSMALVWKG